MSDEVAVNPAFEGLTPEEAGRKIQSSRLYKAAQKRGLDHSALKNALPILYGEQVTSTKDLDYDTMVRLRKFISLLPLVSALKEEARVAVQVEYDAKLEAVKAELKAQMKKAPKKKVLKSRNYTPMGCSVYERAASRGIDMRLEAKR